MNYLRGLSRDIEKRFWIDTPTSRKPSAINSGVIGSASFFPTSKLSLFPGNPVNGLARTQLLGLYLLLALVYLKRNDALLYVYFGPSSLPSPGF